MEQSVSVRARVWVPFNKFSPLRTIGLQGIFLSKSVNVGREPENGKLFLEGLLPQGLVADNDTGRDIQSRLSVAAFRTNGSLESKIALVSDDDQLIKEKHLPTICRHAMPHCMEDHNDNGDENIKDQKQMAW